MTIRCIWGRRRARRETSLGARPRFPRDVKIRTLTPAASIALVSLSAAKARLGIQGSSQDVRLQELIDGLSAAAMRLLRGTVRQEYEVTMSGSGRSRLLLPLRRLDPATLETVDDYCDAETVLEDVRIK